MMFSWKEILAMAPQLILIIGGLGVLIGQMILRSDRTRIAWQICVLSLSVAGIVTAFGLSDVGGTTTFLPRAFYGTNVVTSLNGQFSYSAFSANAILLFITLALAAVFFMQKIAPAQKIDFAENYFLLLMSLVGYSYAVCAQDFATLFVALELGSIPMLILVGLNRKDKATNEAALKYLLLSAFSIAFLLLGIALLYAVSGSLRFKDIHEITPHFLKTKIVVLAYTFVFAAFFFKLAAFPLHSYVADVYEGSPTIFTSLLASFSKVAGLLVFLKISMHINDGFRHYLAPILTLAAIGSMLYGAFASLATNNLKRILAYSSIGHAGFMLCFLVIPTNADVGIMGALKQDAGSALYIYAVGYSFSSLLAFSTIAFLEQRGDAVITLSSLSSLYTRDKTAAWALGISVLSFMGMPPLAGFFGKVFLFKYLAFSNNVSLAAAAAVASAISVYAYIRILRPIFFGEEPAPLETAQPAIKYDDAIKTAGGFLFLVITFFALFVSFLFTTGITSVQKIY